jgi:5'/3'-nucleotidase SurE
MSNFGPLRFATFNASLNRNNTGDLINDLSTGNNAQAQAVASIIQKVNPDIVLLNEFDYDASAEAVHLFQENYLATGEAPIEYPYIYVAPSNTGVPSGADLDNNGDVGGPNDAFGFGFFPGQFGMVLLSKYPIDTARVRTFQNFLWKDMPGALLPDDLTTPEPRDWYSAEELAIFRLSSKSHWDIPIQVNGETIHVLASHPTPPVFDGPEDRNGTRNHDEIRFWSDYITPGQGDYIYDDQGLSGGLAAGSRFVIMGDQNADPYDGDSTNNAILQLLDNPQVNVSTTPGSVGGPDASQRQGQANNSHLGDPFYDTADFADGTPGNLRADYVLPSNNLPIQEAGVFWPAEGEPGFELVGNFPFPSSDHRLVYADVTLARNGADQNRQSVTGFEPLGEVIFPTGYPFADTTVGGLSGITYDANRGLYYSLADDRSAEARFYTLSIDLRDGSLDEGDIRFLASTNLLNADGLPFTGNSLDPEGIALNSRGTLFIASEGDARQIIPPFLNEFSLTGQQISELPVPSQYSPTVDNSSGIRNNLAFESLTITPNQRFLYAATENSLNQDGPRATLENGSLARILKYDLTTGAVIQEFVYEVEAIPQSPDPADGFADNGLVELLAIDNNGTLLAMERSFAVGVGNTIKIFEIQTQGTLDVSRLPDLFREDPLEDDGEVIPPSPFEIDPAVRKREILDVQRDLGISPDNIEGMTLGPILPDGRQSLILVSDNNFNTAQKTQFIAVALEFGTTPAVLPSVETPYTIDDDSSLDLEPLNILLVNDDGYQAEGIQTLYDALVAAGHQVTLVAPKAQQSGKGTLINVDRIFQPTEVVEFAPQQWYVDGSPVVTTLAGLGFVLNGVKPDLVISGINAGENVGQDVAISSGTVSAAATAIHQGIAAIAISAGGRTPEQETAAYKAGSEYLVQLIKELQIKQAPGADLLPDGVGLNVNIPGQFAPGVTGIQGVAYTQLDETGTLEFSFGELPPSFGIGAGVLVSVAQPIDPTAVTDPTSEGQNFLAGYITVTPIDGDWTAESQVRVALKNRLANAPTEGPVAPLTILLTNDDGFDAPGIKALYSQLTAAGHELILVAPKEQQSGTGTALDVDKIFRPTEVTEFSANQWYVDAGVRTTTWAGLDYVLQGEKPDLVISGINEGENIGPGGAVSSGTVSAAVTALLRGVPAIAISAGIDLTDPTRAATDLAYEQGADYIVDLIAQLQATQGNAPYVLPEGLGLSINIPVRFPEGVDDIQGVAFTDESNLSPFRIDFGPLPGGGAGLTFVPFNLPAGAPIDPVSEGAQFLSGYITVTPLDGDWTAPPADYQATEQLLKAPVPVLLGDSDDPAIWVNPTNADESIVIGTLKDGGLAVFDLQGQLLQHVLPADFGDIRYNNVDLVYGFDLGGTPVDLAVVSDRENDTLAIYKVNPATRQLEDVTANSILETVFGIDDGEATVYGLATYKSPVSGKAYAFVTQADGNQVAQVELRDDNGKVSAQVVRTLTLPIPDGGEAADSQSEGIVVDQELGLLYVAIEGEFGILKFSAEPNGGDGYQIIQPVGADYLVPDLEGLSLYYGAEGKGYLIANSQGDSSYAVFSREGTNEYLGSFVVGDNHGIDQVNESDGLDVINVPLGSAFPKGLLVLQDGANDPQNVAEDDEELENNSTNFKFVSWDAVAGAFENPLDIDTTSYDPRHPQVYSLVNGVASGDVTQDSVVLWARSTFPGAVTFEYSTHADFSTIAGTATAIVTDINQPVKVEVSGLTAGTEYVYRVTDAAGDTETGRFLTAAPLGEQTGLRFGVTGDWRGEIAPYPAISNVAEKSLDFFVKHGDTIYADDDSPAVLNPDGTPKDQAVTLEEYRAKHNEVYGQRFGKNSWAAVQASTSVYATIDDHEVTNDFAGGEAVGNDPRFLAAFPDDNPKALINDSSLYENGLQAFQEYNPIRDEFYGETGDPVTAGERKLYRYNRFGSDAATFVLDTRSFRDEAIPGPTDFTNPQEVAQVLAATFTPGRTLLGQVQLDDLKQDLLDAQASGITWKFIMIPEPIQNLFPGISTDAYEGYNAERTALLQFIQESGIENAVFIAADVHMTAVNNLTYQTVPFGPQIATGIWEITTGAVAYEDPTGRFLGEIFTAGDPQLAAFYNSLPIAPDTDNLPNDKDDFVKAAINSSLLAPLGYDPLGLDDNLPQAQGLIDATLLQGDYYVGHSSTWTEFDINPATQTLTVTTWGIDGYTEAELLANPESVLSRMPVILSQFEVNPQGQITGGTQADEELVNGGGNSKLAGFGGNDTLAGDLGDDVILGGDGDDVLRGDRNARNAQTGESGGDDLIFGGAGNDRIGGKSGNDRLFGDAGDDQIWGDDGDDLLQGGPGNDRLTGDNFSGGRVAIPLCWQLAKEPIPSWTLKSALTGSA